MRREELQLTCDLCIDEIGEEVPATVRVRLLDKAGVARSLDLCYTHDGDVRPGELEKLAREYGTPLRTHLTRSGQVRTEPRDRISPRPVFHEPGGAWSGSYVGPAWCQVPLPNDGPCGHPCKNASGVKTHQAAVHGIRVKE